MKNYFDLTGQVAVVTGASAGLGLQMAKAFARQGANLVLLARRKNLLDENAKAIAEEFGVEVFPVQCDITVTEQVVKAVDSIMERFGRIDILVNNAGTGAVAPATEITDEQFKHEFNIDLFGTFVCAREFGKKMIEAGYGRIINIASIYGLVGNMIVGSSPYHAAKGGVVNLTRALAAEWGKYGITVNCICPGYFKTDINAYMFENEKWVQGICKATAVGHVCELDEITAPIVWLAGDHSGSTTGAYILMDGGTTTFI